LTGGGGRAFATAAIANGNALTVPAGYKLVWSDEFNGDGVPDPAKWNFDMANNKRGWDNHELGKPVDSGGLGRPALYLGTADDTGQGSMDLRIF
jgi:hypothetical protein